jgi:ABC-2 type transport system permease protein
MRLRYLIKKELIEIVRQKEMLFLIFIAPVLQIIVLGYVVSTDIRHVPVGIVNLSNGHKAEQIIQRIGHTPLFRVRWVTRRPVDYLSHFKKGGVKSIIIFREALDKKMNLLKYPEVQILMDGVDSNTSLIAAGYFNGIIKNYILNDMSSHGQKLPLRAKSVFRFNPELRSINFMGPGVVGFLLTILTIFLTATSLVREKEQQTLDTLLMSRLSAFEIYIGKALPSALIGIVDMVIGLFVVVTWFGIPFRGNPLDLALTSLVYMTAILSYALLISVLSSTQQQAMFFSWFSLLLFLLLSGFFTPIENIPQFLYFLVDINPLRYLMKIIREIFLKGNGIAYFWKDLLALSGIAVTLVSISLLNFKRFISK